MASTPSSELIESAPTLRAYQQEMFQASMNGNVIVTVGPISVRYVFFDEADCCR